MIRQYYKDADAGFASTIDVGVILTIRWVAIIVCDQLVSHGESVANHAKPAKPSTSSA